MNALVIFHSGCMDGLGAAAAAVRGLGPNTDTWSANYGQDAPFDKAAGRDVYILDFAYPLADMKKLREASNRFVWIDHHDTTEATLAGLKEGDRPQDVLIWSKKHCGAVLTWQYFERGRTPNGGVVQHDAMPAVLRYIEDRDLWFWQLPLAREVSEALFFTYNPSDRANLRLYIDTLLGADIVKMAKVGEILLQSKKLRVDRAAARAQPINIFEKEGFVTYAVNTCEDISEVGEAICVKHACDAAMIYYYGGDSKGWLCSLRSNNGTDVSKLAQLYGGGGHKAAAGFSLDIMTLQKKPKEGA